MYRGVGFQSVGDDQTTVSLPSARRRNSSGTCDNDNGWTSELTPNSTWHVDRPATGVANHGLSSRTRLTLALAAAADSEYPGDRCQYPCNSAAYTPVHNGIVYLTYFAMANTL